jgi:hypothetical protein
VAAAAGDGFPAWDLWLVAGVAAGGWLAARRRGTIVLASPGPGALVRRLVGGAGLGAGASIATGCTVGQGLTGLALLAPSSVVVMTSIFAGVALTTLVARRQEHGAAAVPARG